MDPSNEIFSLGTWRGMRVLSYTFGALSGQHWREVAYIWGVARLWDWSSSTIKSSSEHVRVWSMGCQPSPSSAKSLVYPTAVPGLARLQWWMKPWVVWVWNVFVCALQRWKHWFGFKVNRASCKKSPSVASCCKVDCWHGLLWPRGSFAVRSLSPCSVASQVTFLLSLSVYNMAGLSDLLYFTTFELPFPLLDSFLLSFFFLCLNPHLSFHPTPGCFWLLTSQAIPCSYLGPSTV